MSASTEHELRNQVMPVARTSVPLICSAAAPASRSGSAACSNGSSPGLRPGSRHHKAKSRSQVQLASARTNSSEVFELRWKAATCSDVAEAYFLRSATEQSTRHLQSVRRKSVIGIGVKCRRSAATSLRDPARCAVVEAEFMLRFCKSTAGALHLDRRSLAASRPLNGVQITKPMRIGR